MGGLGRADTEKDKQDLWAGYLLGQRRIEAAAALLDRGEVERRRVGDGLDVLIFFVSLSSRGIAGNGPLFIRSGTACGKTNDVSRSGLWSRLRYLVHQLVSTLSFMRLVSRSFVLLAPVA